MFQRVLSWCLSVVYVSVRVCKCEGVCEVRGCVPCGPQSASGCVGCLRTFRMTQATPPALSHWFP